MSVRTNLEIQRWSNQAEYNQFVFWRLLFGEEARRQHRLPRLYTRVRPLLLITDNETSIVSALLVKPRVQSQLSLFPSPPLSQTASLSTWRSVCPTLGLASSRRATRCARDIPGDLRPQLTLGRCTPQMHSGIEEAVIRYAFVHALAGQETQI